MSELALPKGGEPRAGGLGAVLRHVRYVLRENAVTGFAFGPECSDAMVSRLAKAFDRFIDVRAKSNFEVAGLARELGIDIAIDLNGFTVHCRAEIFALRGM